MLKDLRSNHREIARLTHQGIKPSEISERLGINIGTVYLIRRDPLFKQALAKLDDEADKEIIDVRKRLAEMSLKAVDRLDNLLDSYDDKVSLSASKDVLDRAGYKPPEVTQNYHAHAHFTADDIEELKSRAAAAGAMVVEEKEESLRAEGPQNTESGDDSSDSIFFPSLLAPPGEYLMEKFHIRRNNDY